MRPLFFVGRSPDPLVEAEIRSESGDFRDVIQADFLDTYKNLTFKAMSWMLWVDLYCPEVSTLVKTDDDMILDVFKLKNYTKDMTDKDRIHCRK